MRVGEVTQMHPTTDPASFGIPTYVIADFECLCDFSACSMTFLRVGLRVSIRRLFPLRQPSLAQALRDDRQ
jgi:hypothetical protein